MAYVYDFDRKGVIMATGDPSHKLANIRKHPKVSLLVDNRNEGQKSDEIGAERSGMWALTVTGTAHIIAQPDETEALKNIIIGAHPHLQDFVSSPSTVVLCVVADSYLLLEGVEKASYIEVKA
jgi:nitroimidazol reductase NimA-like FMN-containing flavoprotein (pyridoxamine 5'-phosphate oxidase superfamily)